MNSTSESNTIDSTTERTGVQEKPELGSVNKEHKIDTNTQTIGQVHINMRINMHRWV